MRRLKLIVFGVVLLGLTGCVTTPLIGPTADSEFEVGLALFEQGRYQDAIDHFNRAIELEPEHAQSYLYLGRSLFHLGRWLEAVSYLRGAYLRVPPEKQKEIIVELLDSLIKGGITLFKQGNFVNAIALLKEALRLAPESEQAKEELGGVLMAFGNQMLSEGRFTDAIEAYSESLALTPDQIQSYVGLARAFLEKGDFSKALKTIQEALRAAPESDDVQALFSQILKAL